MRDCEGFRRLTLQTIEAGGADVVVVAGYAAKGALVEVIDGA